MAATQLLVASARYVTVAMCSLVLALLLFMISMVFLEYIYWKRRKMLELPVTPIVGMHAPIYLKKRSFADHTQHLYNMYPDSKYYGTFDLHTPVIVLKDPDLIRDITVKYFDNFPDHKSFVTEEMDPIVGRNVFSLTGQRWRDFRNTLSPSFTSNKMKIMFHLVSACSKEFVQYFVNHPELTYNLETKDAFTRYTNDVIASAAFGIEVNSLRNPQNEFYLYGKDATSFSEPKRLLKYLLLRACPKLVQLTGERFLSRATNKFFTELVSNTVRTRERQGIIRPDMIHLLMQAKDKDNGIDVTIDDIIGQAFIFFLAGFETTSTLMCFIALELAAHPEIQRKVQDEIDNQWEKDNGEITYDSLANLKYLDMVINETLRLYPPVPMTDRVCVKAFEIQSCKEGYPNCRVEVGTNLVIPIFGLHRDPQYFANPRQFDPERFSDENKDKINPYVYLPFGVGPRKCIGNRFALMESKTLFVHVLRKFNFKLTEKSKYPPVFCKKTFNVAVYGGFFIQLEERK